MKKRYEIEEAVFYSHEKLKDEWCCSIWVYTTIGENIEKISEQDVWGDTKEEAFEKMMKWIEEDKRADSKP